MTRSVTAASGYVTTIDCGELRKFTADVKGELPKSGAYRLTPGEPWTQTNTEKLYDIIARIKQGYYPAADYVLFGSINSIWFCNMASPVQGFYRDHLFAVARPRRRVLADQYAHLRRSRRRFRRPARAATHGSSAVVGQSITLKQGQGDAGGLALARCGGRQPMEAQFVPVASGRSDSIQHSSTTTREGKVTVFR